jgi:hypothetical protein
MTLRRLASVSVLAALLPAVGACGEQPAAGPTVAQVSIASRIVVPSCTGGVHPRQMPLRVALALEGRGGRLRVTTSARGNGSVRLTPGRYAVALPRGVVVSLRFDGSAVPASGARHVVDVAAGRHRMVVLMALHPGECNSLGTAE